MTPVFLFGPLLNAALFEAVLDQSLDTAAPATLAAHRCVMHKAPFTVRLAERAGEDVPGVVLGELPPETRARLEFFFAVAGCAETQAHIISQGARVQASCFSSRSLVPDAEAFDATTWTELWAAISVRAAQEIMSHYPGDVDTPRRRLGQILTRATAWGAAQTTPPTRLRRRATSQDLSILAQRRPYAHFFSVEEYDLQHRKFDGTMSAPMERAVFVSADAATVLPYDPRRDHVMLIEQFRTGPMARGDRQCWSLEAVAGRIDPGDDAESTARREAIEEAGITLGKLHKVSSYYPSPGAKTEYLTSYIGECDLPLRSAGSGGLAEEDEDIRTHIVPFDEAMQLFETGEIENAALIISLLWIGAHRDRLRARD